MNIKKFSIQFQSPKLYNFLADEIKEASSITSLIPYLQNILAFDWLFYGVFSFNPCN